MNRATKKNMLAAVLVLVLLFAINAPVTVEAASKKDYKSVKLKQNTWASNSNKYDNNLGYDKYYKITVPKAGSLAFTLSGSARVTVYTSISKKSEGSYIDLNDSKTVAVDKGTYYLFVRRGKCKYKFNAAPSQKNYCMQRAQKLKANKIAKAFMTPKYGFSRWYKIYNPKNKKITITLNKAHDFVIMDSEGYYISTIEKGSKTKFCTRRDQPKGTYYIRILSDRNTPDDGYAFGEYVTLKWK